MEKTETIGYRILNIQTNQFAAFAMPAETGLNMDRLSLNTSLSFGVSPKERTFMCRLEILVGNGDIPVLKIETQANYLLQAEYLNNLIENDQFEMQVPEVEYFTSILYGATRGILLCKLEDTEFKNFILPPIDLYKIITHPLIIGLGENI